MTTFSRNAAARRWAAAAGTGLMLIASAALADPPHGKGKKHGGHEREGGGTEASVNVSVTFTDQDRIVIRDYYGARMAAGHCPPGLAKKNNGCLPPGRAKKWAIGQRLPRDVVFYDLPPQLTVKLSVPPSGYKYVRVAKDILLIAAGTGMVAAAVEDLAQL